IAKDGSTLYVGLDGSGSVVQVNLQAMVVEGSLWLGNDPSVGPQSARSLAVAPGDSGVVAIARMSQSVVIESHGVQLPHVVNSPFTRIASVAFGDDADLYGYNNLDTGFDLYRLKVDSSGVTIFGNQSRLFYGFYADIIADSGLLYSTNGSVVEPTQNILAGGFAGASTGLSVALDNSEGR